MIRCVSVLLLISACVQPPPIVVPECQVAERLVFDVTQSSQRVTLSNSFDSPRVMTITAPLAPFTVEPVGIVRLEPHEVRDVILRYSPAITADVPWQFTPAAGCEPVDLTLSGVAGDAAVSASPGRLDFGNLPASPRTLTLRNHTHSEVKVLSLAFSTSAFSSTTALPLNLPALGSVELTVEARGVGSLDGTLTIRTDVLQLEVPLLANRPGPCLVAARSSIDFGSTELACRARDELISVTNTCPHAVRDVLTAISPGFTIVAGVPTSVLGAGLSASFAVTSALDAAGQSSGTFTVSADVLDGTETVAVQLGAERTPMVMREEVYLNPRPLRDVLIVLDDSPSVAPFNDTLRVAMNRLAHQLIASQESVRVGVMTTSTAPAELARLRRTPSGQTWLENPSVEEVEALTMLTMTSTARSSCLEVLHEAFETRTELGPMLRPGAFLQVVCISSQADGIQVPAAPLLSSLGSLMPRPRGLTVVGNFGTVPSCAAEPDTGVLASLAELSFARREEICGPMWNLLDQTSHFGPRTNFFLSERPDLTRGPIEVSVNGVALSEGPMTWTYLPENNSVNFEPLYVPGYDETLRLRYAPFCR